MSAIVLDVRNSDEFHREHIPSSIHIPLDEIDFKVGGVLELLRGREVTLMCASGARAGIACERLRGLESDYSVKFKAFPGGISKWKQEGVPVVSQAENSFTLPLTRQVHSIAGLSTLSFALLVAFVSPHFVWGAAFFGAGLSVAGLTGFCGMGYLLAKMQWNRPSAARRPLPVMKGSQATR